MTLIILISRRRVFKPREYGGLIRTDWIVSIINMLINRWDCLTGKCKCGFKEA